MSDLVVAFGVMAVVLMVTAIASGVIERSPISFSVIFLGLGIALSEFDVLTIDAHAPLLEAVGTVTLALVLFLDATRLQVEELGRRWVVPARILGPGTLLIVGLGAAAVRVLFDMPWVLALMTGAVLASTDPVLLRELLRDSRIPRSIRQVLKLEAGMNDLVVLPIILVLIALATAEVSGFAGWTMFLLRLLVLGPGMGALIGGVGAWAVSRVDRAMGIRQEHQALYGVGLVLAAYAAATAIGGDGFLSAFAAGLSVTLLNQTLCDCFLEFGETIAEAAMLLSFVLFGAVLDGQITTRILVPGLALAAFVVFVVRPLAMVAVLLFSEMSNAGRVFVGWLGPRGLASLLLALLAIQHHVEGADDLLAVVGVVVLFSSFVHGASTPLVLRWYLRRVDEHTLAEEREGSAAVLWPEPGAHVRDSITSEELASLLASPTPPVVLDVRSRSDYRNAQWRIPGALRVLPDEVGPWTGEWLEGHDRRRLIVAYCT